MTFIYTANWSEDDAALAGMELRAFFGESARDMIKTNRNIHASRSAFVREKLTILIEAGSKEELIKQAASLSAGEQTFKVVFMKQTDLPPSEQVDYKGRMEIERAVGWEINGEADMKKPDVLYGIAVCGGKWHLGLYERNKRPWEQRVKKPREYSTALSARDARVAANIAVPHPEGKKAIDPCCGIGTVVVEALAMGIEMDGRDQNPAAADGAKENVTHFGLTGSVEHGAIEDALSGYDAAVIDMPYNLCSHFSDRALQSIVTNARRIASRAVIVSIDPIDEMIETAGFRIAEKAVAKKGTFERRWYVCESM